MDVLIAGATGGREHALGLALMEDGASGVEFTHGGNAGAHELGFVSDLTQNIDIANYAAKHAIDLVVVGPEGPLVDGLSDLLLARGVATFGPIKRGAELEASKVYTAEFNDEFGIPQPGYTVDVTIAGAVDAVKRRKPESYVIKADGLAGGKGVVLPDTKEEAEQTVTGMLSGEMFGQAGKRIMLQRRLDAAGPELSAMYVLDGSNFTLLPLAQDHKRLEDGDNGPNTGGMGAYAPVPFTEPELIDDLLDIGSRITEGLQKRDIDYRGVVFAGIMLDKARRNKPSVLEINARFGDPETQVVLARLGQLGINRLDLLKSAANGSLDPSMRGAYLDKAIGGSALTVCLAAGGYPKTPADNVMIRGLNHKYEGVTIHHAGTKDGVNSGPLAKGGRIVYVTAVGKDADQAATRAYAAIGENGVHFAGMRYRKDIAWQARSAA